MARVIARLHGRELWRRATERTDEGRRFDQMWESFGPAPPVPARKPRTVAARSRSLVPVDAPVGEAWSTWARAMTLLRATR
jgi:hypothetical protein